MAHDKRVIFSADDFGMTPRINAAVAAAHDGGLLASASLMPCEPHAEAAVELARSRPKLELGLHLVLCQGRSALPPGEIPGLVRGDGTFPESPVWTGMKLFFAPWLRGQLEREIAAQLARFRALVGRAPAFVNGHLNIHVHPTVLPILLAACRREGVRAMRLPREPAAEVLALDARGRLGTRLNGFIFERLSSRAVRRAREAGIAHPARCYGVLRPFGMTERFVEGLLERLEPGLTEIYFHPGHPAHGADDPELAALQSARLRARVEALGLGLARYDDAVARDPVAPPAPDHVTA